VSKVQHTSLRIAAIYDLQVRPPGTGHSPLRDQWGLILGATGGRRCDTPGSNTRGHGHTMDRWRRRGCRGGRSSGEAVCPRRGSGGRSDSTHGLRSGTTETAGSVRRSAEAVARARWSIRALPSACSGHARSCPPSHWSAAFVPPRRGEFIQGRFRRLRMSASVGPAAPAALGRCAPGVRIPPSIRCTCRVRRRT